MNDVLVPNISSAPRAVPFSSERLNQVGREIDYFALHGCRNMVMQLVVISLRDLISNNAALRNDALYWFDPEKGKDRKVKFEDCVLQMGCASRIAKFREIVFSGDTDRIAQLANTIESHIHKPESNVQDSVEGMTLEKSGIETLQAAFR